jgi:type II secretory pathway pseudopilin PulG
MLVAVMFLMAILVLSMAVAAPIIKKQIQHDRDVETMHRGKQYIRAIRMYYKAFGSYPPTVDALLNTNKIRFLRKKYIDPTTGKPDWKIIHFGQNKVPTAWGFFGQPLTGTTVAGIGPGGTAGSGLSGSGGIGSPPGAIGAPAPTDPNSNPNGQTTPADPNNPGGATGTGAPGTTGTTTPGAAGTGTGLTGQTFGGGGIIGVSPNSPKQSILLLHKKNHYNEWEFVYDPLSEQMMMQGGNTGLGGQPAGSTNPASTTPPGSTAIPGSTITPTPTPTPPSQ